MLGKDQRSSRTQIEHLQLYYSNTGQYSTEQQYARHKTSVGFKLALAQELEQVGW